MKKPLYLWLIILFFLLAQSPQLASAQDPLISWDTPINISRSGDKTSSYPFVLADPAGRVHLFWAEKVNDIPGDQPDTIMYTVWDGEVWSEPVDLFYAPLSDGNPMVSSPTAVLDNHGIMHLIWMPQPNYPNSSLFYSSVPVDEAQSAGAWEKPAILAEDLTGTKYSIDIAYTPPDTLHILYARVMQGDNPPEQRGVSYMRSTDGGATWFDPVEIHKITDLNRGASDVRLITSGSNKVFASWTEWDQTGNGQAIYFARSMDNGETWDKPVLLAERKGDEYERDWNSMVVLGDGRLMSMWEGGRRAYRYAMYSSDDGQTWSEPIDTFPWLIGENGSAEFVYDGAGNLHLFISQRIREGSVGKVGGPGIWHSLWVNGTQWQEPTLEGDSQPVLSPKVAIVEGNRVAIAWYSTVHYEIYVMTGRIEGVPSAAPIRWPTRVPESTVVASVTSTPEVVSTTASGGPEATQAITHTDSITNSRSGESDLERSILISTGLTIFTVTLLFVYAVWKRARVYHKLK